MLIPVWLARLGLGGVRRWLWWWLRVCGPGLLSFSGSGGFFALLLRAIGLFAGLGSHCLVKAEEGDYPADLRVGELTVGVDVSDGAPWRPVGGHAAISLLSSSVIPRA